MGQHHSGFAHKRHGQAQPAFEEISTGDEQRSGCTAGRGIGEKGKPEKTGHRYNIGHDDLL
jgi:hypothetical protein